LKKTFEDISDSFRPGDIKAFEQLYDRYADSLYGVILKMVKDEAIAKDALQESFMKIWKNAAKYDPNKAKIFTWIYQIARNTALDKLRSQTKKINREIQLKDSNVHNIGKEAINPDTVDLTEVLGQIDPKYQEVIKALFFGGMTQDETSKHLNIPLGTVKTRLKIGLRELRKIFKNEAFLTIGFFNLLKLLEQSEFIWW